MLDQLAEARVPVDLRFLWRPRVTDPDDDMVPETAISGGADTLATFNVRHLAAAAACFGITAGRPADLLRRLP